MAPHRPGDGGHLGVCGCGVCHMADGERLVFVGVGIVCGMVEVIWYGTNRR